MREGAFPSGYNRKPQPFSLPLRNVGQVLGRRGLVARGTSDSRGTPVSGWPYFTAVETEMRSPSFSSPHPVSPWFQPMEHSEATADGLFISTLASLPAYLRDPRPQAQQQTVYK